MTTTYKFSSLVDGDIVVCCRVVVDDVLLDGGDLIAHLQVFNANLNSKSSEGLFIQELLLLSKDIIS